MTSAFNSSTFSATPAYPSHFKSDENNLDREILSIAHTASPEQIVITYGTYT